jgi:aquaporin NIP
MMEAAGLTPPNGASAPLFAGPRVDSMSYERKSMPRCKCLPAVEATWGVATHTCVVEIPAPDATLTRKVRHAHAPS